MRNFKTIFVNNEGKEIIISNESLQLKRVVALRKAYRLRNGIEEPSGCATRAVIEAAFQLAHVNHPKKNVSHISF